MYCPVKVTQPALAFGRLNQHLAPQFRVSVQYRLFSKIIGDGYGCAEVSPLVSCPYQPNANTHSIVFSADGRISSFQSRNEQLLSLTEASFFQIRCGLLY
ncbi:MAG: hypothetical protein ACJ746_17645 [Bryobacteraceae bacterium]